MIKSSGVPSGSLGSDPIGCELSVRKSTSPEASAMPLKSLARRSGEGNRDGLSTPKMELLSAADTCDERSTIPDRKRSD
ncbi:MAG: hypothetical protein IID33_08945 [Planctomycetes bacterium]|nr:hypothetical protein [Planctomycetota bacterium]